MDVINKVSAQNTENNTPPHTSLQLAAYRSLETTKQRHQQCIAVAVNFTNVVSTKLTTANSPIK